MVSLTIDGRGVAVSEGESVLEAALAHGIDIPRLCHHPELAPGGACRLCLVEVEGARSPMPSCGLQVTEGMVVFTRSERLVRLRRDVLDLLLSDHPLRCMVCEKSGACELQRYAYEFGLAESSHPVEVARDLYQDDNPFFVRDHQYCILCTRCVRVCDEVVGAKAIDIAGRGFGARVSSPFDLPLAESDCVFCGNCVQVCPTAALLPVSRRGKGREWELERTRTVCGYCGVGCGIEILTRNGRVAYVRGYPGAPANGEFLCAKGRFGWDYLHHPDRLTRPLVRRDLAEAAGLVSEEAPGAPPEAPAPAPARRGRARQDFVEVDWGVALDLAADRLAAAVAAHGPDAVAGLCSAKCTNEENYLFQKLLRGVLGTNNIDHCARL